MTTHEDVTSAAGSVAAIYQLNYAALMAGKLRRRTLTAARRVIVSRLTGKHGDSAVAAALGIDRTTVIRMRAVSLDESVSYLVGAMPKAPGPQLPEIHSGDSWKKSYDRIVEALKECPLTDRPMLWREACVRLFPHSAKRQQPPRGVEWPDETV